LGAFATHISGIPGLKNIRDSRNSETDLFQGRFFDVQLSCLIRASGGVAARRGHAASASSTRISACRPIILHRISLARCFPVFMGTMTCYLTGLDCLPGKKNTIRFH